VEESAEDYWGWWPVGSEISESAAWFGELWGWGGILDGMVW
jgi:hypothetical protein